MKLFPHRWQRALAGTTACSGVLAIVFPRVVFGGEVFYCRDMGSLHFPLRSYIAERLRQGELPLWFPFEGLGVPLVGSTVSALFHPTTLLYLVMPVADALRVDCLLSVAIGLLGTWALARRLGAPGWAAATAAAAFALSGSFVSLLNNKTFLNAAGMYPVFLWGVHLAVTDARGSGIAVASGALALVVLGGDIQGAYLFGLVGVAFAAGIAASRSTAALRRVAGPLAAIGLLGATLAAVQLLPAWQTLGEIDRGAGLDAAEALTWSLHPLRIPDLLVGDVVGWVPNAPNLNPIRLHLLGSRGLWSTTLFVGTPAVLGAAWAVALPGASDRRTDLTLAAIAAVLVWLALGQYGGLYPLFHRLLPLWSTFRFPEKLALHATLPLALLAARGLARASGAPREWRTRATLVAVVAVFAAVAVGALGIARAVEGADGRADALRLYLTRVATAGVWAALMAAAVGALVVGVSRFRHGVWFSGLVPLLILAQLARVNGRVADDCTTFRELLEARSEIADAIQRHDGPALGRYRVTPSFARLRSLNAAPGRRADLSPGERYALWERAALLPDHNALSGIESTAGILPVLPRHYRVLRSAGLPQRHIALYNNRYLVTTPEDRSQLPVATGDPVVSIADLNLVAVPMPGERPRAFVAAPRSVRSAEEAVPLLDRPEVASGRQALIEAPLVPTDVPEAHGEVRIVSYAPERIELEADLETPAVVVVNDSYFPGWVAEIDGARTEVLRANVLVRAVRVPAGPHRLVLRYPPPASLERGAALSLAAWLGCGTALVVRAIVRRRRGYPPPVAQG